MKKIQNITICVAFLGLFLASCTKDRTTEGKKQDVTITINTGTRSGTDKPGEGTDNDIVSLRILGYTSNGTLAFNRSTTTFGASGDNKTTTFVVPTGKYHLVFIANEGSDEDVDTHKAISYHFDTDDSKIATLTALKNLTFGYKAFHKDKPVPMMSYYENVSILGDNQIEYLGSAYSLWNIKIDRIGVKVEIAITLTEAQANKLKTKYGDGNPWLLNISGLPSECYLFPEKDNSTLALRNQNFFAYSGDATGKEGKINWPGETGEATITFERLILPELIFSTLTNASKAAVMSLDFGDKTVTAKLGHTVGKNIDEADLDYTLPRNHWLKFTGKAITEVELFISVDVADWDDENIDDVEVH